MAYKRPLESSPEPNPQKRTKKGFSVGPQNLPDGTYKRKVDKIRRKLVENAKIKKSYDKLKARELKNLTEAEDESAAITPHPARQALIDTEEERRQEAPPSKADKDGEDHGSGDEQSAASRRKKRPRQQLYLREQRAADAQKQEFDKRREEAAVSRAERDKRLAERERWRRTLANARGDGKRRKLGKESTVLLEKVKRMMGKEKV